MSIVGGARFATKMESGMRVHADRHSIRASSHFFAHASRWFAGPASQSATHLVDAAGHSSRSHFMRGAHRLRSMAMPRESMPFGVADRPKAPARVRKGLA